MQDCVIHDVMPHMHMLGREIKVTVTPPDGTPTTLIAINDWDYNWQETYFLKEPMAIKKGTILSVDAVYDNSDKNPQNPFSPPRVRVPRRTDDERDVLHLHRRHVGRAGPHPVRAAGRQAVRRPAAGRGGEAVNLASGGRQPPDSASCRRPHEESGG